MLYLLIKSVPPPNLLPRMLLSLVIGIARMVGGLLPDSIDSTGSSDVGSMAKDVDSHY